MIDEELVFHDGIDLIIGELDRCFEVTRNQDQASKIERALQLTQRDMKQDPNFLSCVTGRSLHFQQLKNAQGGALPSVIKGFATLRDTKLNEGRYEKVEMWTVGSP